MGKSCPSCKWLLRDAPAPNWYQCGFPEPLRVPKALQVVHVAVNIAAPFRDCAAWEEATP